MSEILKIRRRLIGSEASQYLIVISAVGITAFLCRPLSTQQGYYIVSFILLFVVSLMAVFMSIGPILVASTISALVWNFFFIPPHFALMIDRTEDRLMFVSFFFIALINGVLTNRIRRQESLALEREERTKAIFELTRELSNTNGLTGIMDVSYRDAVKFFNAVSLFYLRRNESSISILSRTGREEESSRVDMGIAEWVFTNMISAGRFTDFYSDTRLTYFPLTGTRFNPGVIAVEFEERLSGEKEIFWTGYLDQISIALERELLGELALKARVLGESDKLYKTLFTLISHEFRIPIAAIMGASDTLLMPRTTENDRVQLFNEIFKASARLNQLVENLLNMSRLESGKISVHSDWCDINDILNIVIRNLRHELMPFRLSVSVQPDMPPVKVDFGLMEQVIFNLILNSCQYSAPGSVIGFEAEYFMGNLVIRVEDNGPGLPPEMTGRVFDKFFRADGSRPGGLGLGLSIVRGIVEAHGGTVGAENLKPGGVRFTIMIPSAIPDLKSIKSEL